MHLIWYWLVAFQDAEGKFPCILGHEGAGYDPFKTQYHSLSMMWKQNSYFWFDDGM
jgi:hypothetical protein